MNFMSINLENNENNKTIAESKEKIVNLSLFSSREEADELRKTAESDDAGISFYAKKALEVIDLRGGASRAPLDYPVKLEDFQRPEPEIRIKSIRILVTERISDFLLFLMDMAGKETNEFVLGAALTAIGSLGTGSETEWLSQFLNDSSRMVRLSAISGMEILGSPDAIIYALDLSDDPDTEISERAKRIVANIHADQCRDIVNKLVEEKGGSTGKAMKILECKKFPADFLLSLMEIEGLSTDEKLTLLKYIPEKTMFSPEELERMKKLAETAEEPLKTELEKLIPAAEPAEPAEPAEQESVAEVETPPEEGKEAKEAIPVKEEAGEDPDVIKGKVFVLRKIGDLYMYKAPGAEITGSTELMEQRDKLSELLVKVDEKKASLITEEEKDIKKTGGFFGKALDGISKFGEITKIKLEIAQLESDRDQVRLNIGRELYRLYSLGNSFDAEMTELLEKIDKIDEQTAKKEEKGVMSDIMAKTPDSAMKYVEKAGEIFEDIKAKAINHTRYETLKFQIESQNNGIKQNFYELGRYVFLRYRDGMDAYKVDVSRIRRIEYLKSKVQFLEVEKEGHKQASTGSIKRTGDRKGKGVVEELGRRTGEAQAVFKVENQIREEKKNVENEYIELGQQLLDAYPDGEEDAKIEDLKRTIKKQKEKLSQMEAEMKESQDKISRDRLDSMLRKRKSLLQEVDELTGKIVETFGTEMAVLSINIRYFPDENIHPNKDAMLKMQDDFSGFVIPVVEELGGEVLQKCDGEIISGFKEPEQAVMTSIELLQRLDGINETLDEETRIYMGIAISMGRVLQVDGGIMGDAACRVSQLGNVTPGGRVHITHSLYDRIEKDKFRYEEISPCYAKEGEESEKAYRLIF